LSIVQSRLARNIIYNLLGQGALLILAFIAVRFLFRRLGPDAFGIIMFTQTLSVVLVGLLELGIGSTVVREVAAHEGEDKAYIANLLRTAALFAWALFGLLGLITLEVAPLLVDRWVHLSSLGSKEATTALMVLGVASLTALPRSVYASLFRGRQRMAVNNAIDVGVAILQQLGTLAVLALGAGLFAVVGWFATTYVLGLVAYVIAAGLAVGWRALVPAYSKGIVRKNWRFSASLLSISTLSVLLTQVDKIVVSKVLPIGVLGSYGFAWTMVSRVGLVAGSIAEAAFPSFSQGLRHEDRRTSTIVYRTLQELLNFGLIPLYAAAAFGAEPLFTYLFGSRVASTLVVPVILLSVGFYMNGTLFVPYVFSLADGRPDITARQNLLALVVTIPMSIASISTLGLTGAGISWVFCHVFCYAYGVPRYCRECLRMPVRSWYAWVARPMGLAACTYGAAGVALVATNELSVGALAAAYMCASLIFALVGWRMMAPELRAAARAATVRVTAALAGGLGEAVDRAA
jgi:O-antigen/teichoic acid export membrane protein